MPARGPKDPPGRHDRPQGLAGRCAHIADRHALPILIALPIGDDQSDVVTGGGETPALLQEHPGVVSSVDRCQLSDPTHEHGVPAVGPISMAP